jgi:hypothetical protein
MERSVDMGRHTCAALALAALTLLAGCGQPSDPIGAPLSPAPTSAPADVPSPQAEMVCQPEAQSDIEDLIGVVPSQVGPIQYANHVSTCRYTYANGSFTLIVQDLPNDLTTTKAYEALAGKLGRVDAIDLPDAQAFSTTEGSIVLRKDTKVMLVDVDGLPSTFGSPPSPRADAARLIMKAVLGCWTGE